MPSKPYSAPKVTTVGTVADLTAAFNKNGPHGDSYVPSAVIVGSAVTPAP